VNKAIITFSAVVFGIAGSYLPFLFGVTDIFSGWSIFMGFVGGFFGIWLGVWISKRLG